MRKYQPAPVVEDPHRRGLEYVIERSRRNAIRSSEARSTPRNGELIDVFPCAGHRTNVVFADVCGRDAEADGHAHYLRHLVRMLVDLHSPASLLECVNLAFCRCLADDGNGRLASIFFASEHRGLLTYASAGHDFALLRRSNGRHCRLPPTGKNLGIKAPQHYAENTVSVAPGDLLLLVSEGITGSVDASGASFGASGVMEVALGVAGDPAANILEAAKAYGRRGSFDNASVLCIHIS